MPAIGHACNYGRTMTVVEHGNRRETGTGSSCDLDDRKRRPFSAGRKSSRFAVERHYSASVMRDIDATLFSAHR
jgi:hypothetical protein